VEVSQDIPNEIGLTWEAVPNAAYYSVWVKVGTAAWSRLTTNNNLTATEYTVTNPPSGTVKYGVKAHNGSYTSGMGSKSVDIPVVISAPVIEAEFQGNRTVSITWNSVSNATGYTIYRRETGTTGWSQVNTTTLTTTSFTDTNVPFGDWDYCVVASNDAVSSADSNVASVSVTLDAPSTIQATLDSSGVTVTWSAVTQATHYSVWIKVGDAAWTKIANQVSGTSYVDTNPPAGSVKYGVKAHNGSEASARKNTQQALTVPLPTPATMTATLPGDGSVNLTWDTVSGATYYSVYVRNSDGTWTSLANNVTSTSFVDVTPSSGTVEYGVKAHNAALTSDIASATITVPIPLPPFGAPEVQTTLQSDGSVLITWGEVEDADRYTVWYKETGGSWVKLTNNGVNGSYTMTNPPTGNIQFTVKAHNGTIVSGTNLVTLYVPGSTSLPEFGAPEVQATLQSDGSVLITWGEVQNADRYTVWYKETGGSWIKLSNNAADGTYTVTNPPTGEVQFTVKAHNGTVASGINAVTLNISEPTSPSLPPFGAPEVLAELQDDGSVLITWGEVEDADHYTVWYKEAEGSWVKLTNNGTNGSYIMTNPPVGVIQFTVKAHNGTIVSGINPATLTIV
jgi:fibronectin type 3 domain-containing protein